MDIPNPNQKGLIDAIRKSYMNFKINGKPTLEKLCDEMGYLRLSILAKAEAEDYRHLVGQPE